MIFHQRSTSSLARLGLVLRSFMPALYPTMLEEMESFTDLHGNFSEAELPKMS
jgi:hypothetical protein